MWEFGEVSGLFVLDLGQTEGSYKVKATAKVGRAKDLIGGHESSRFVIS